MNEEVMNRNLPHKMDILFYNSYIKAKNAYIKRILYHTVKLLLVLIFLPIDIILLKTENNVIIAWLAVAIAASVFNIFVSIQMVYHLFSDNQKNNANILTLAANHQHSINAQPIEKKQDLKSLKKCVSATMYNLPNQTEINNEGLTSDLKKRYQTVYSRAIDQNLLEMSPCLSIFDGFSKFGSFCCLVFGIVALAISKPLPAEIGVGVAYLILEALSVYIAIIFFIILALSPIIIFFLCIYCCCCRVDPRQNEYRLPQGTPATADMIKETDGTCNICLQNFELKKNVVILPCSKKHMFHEGCITNWVNISMTCPICRYKLNNQHQPI